MMKKLVSLLLALILTLSLCTPVLAAPGDNEGDVPQQGQQENNGPQWPKGTEKTIIKHITVVQVLVRGAV